MGLLLMSSMYKLIYWDWYIILMKIKNVAVAFLVLLVVLTKNKNKKSSYVNNLVVATPMNKKKNTKTPPYEQSCCYHVLGTRKKYGEKIIGAEKKFARKKNLARKKIQIFLLKLRIKKILRPPQEIIQVFHILMLYLFVR